MDTNDTLQETFNLAIVEELMRKVNPNVTEDDINSVWSNCGGNPWNAGILYTMIRSAHI